MERIIEKADFERLLGTRSRVRSAHFSLHHVAGAPLTRKWVPKGAGHTELSTGPAPNYPQAVDDWLASGLGLWFGCVVPKRHARRAVTRSLLKRQARSAFLRHQRSLPAGMWLLRLRSPFPVAEFVSARSAALALAARTELDGLLGRVGA